MESRNPAVLVDALPSSNAIARTGCPFPLRSSIIASSKRKPRAPRAVRSDARMPPGSAALCESCRDVDRVTRDHRLTGLWIDGREDLAGVHPDPDLQRHAGRPSAGR